MQRQRRAGDIFGPRPGSVAETVDCCPMCFHALDEQGPEEFAQIVARWFRHLRKRPTPPAACLATVNIKTGRWHGQPPCPCRWQFHGS